MDFPLPDVRVEGVADFFLATVWDVEVAFADDLFGGGFEMPVRGVEAFGGSTDTAKVSGTLGMEFWPVL
jgi:hypothetical protein